MAKLTPKQQSFVKEYLIDLNASKAAQRAGYSEKTAYSIGQENLNKPEIAEAIDAAIAERNERTEINADWVLRQAVELHKRCMQTVPVTDKDGAVTGEYKFEHAGAAKSLELIGKHVGVQAFKEKIDVTGNHTVNHKSEPVSETVSFIEGSIGTKALEPPEDTLPN